MLESSNGDSVAGGGGGYTSNATKAAAIYSVDISSCGTKFATGGGDGTVRIWNTGALFLKAAGSGTSASASRMGRYKSKKELLEEMENDPQKANGNNMMSSTLSSTMTSGVTHTVYESSGESSMDDNNSSFLESPKPSPDADARTKQQQQPSSLSSSATNNLPSNMEEEDDDDDDADDEVVHDLTNVVRKKKSNSSSSVGITTTNSPPQNSQKNPSGISAAGAAGGLLSPSSHHHHSKRYNPHHRLLCTLSAHTGSSVLAVRFSTDGKFLASAGDDAVVCIYTQQQQQNLAATGNLTDQHHAVEHWLRIKVCRGHGLDVVGLAWAPDDSHLVSCSLDSTTPIIVWKLTDIVGGGGNHDNNGKDNLRSPTSSSRYSYSNMLCNPYKILGRGIHTSTVKGVTFDPAGTYLASSGDDPSVCIWRAHDDWGLEKRIDASAGIFRQWSRGVGGDGQPIQDTSSQSLFRRLSWSTDGAYICSTNSIVKNKHVASTISRDGWAVSSARSTASGAANLVGHKQPVVACRHSPYLLKYSSISDTGSEEEEDDDEPEYATLLALGDKRGFVTVWSTKKSRPVFKIQCSETRCTVTDLAWGRVGNVGAGPISSGKDLMLIVSLLDGQVVAIRFNVPDEVGQLLTTSEQARVFQLRYGIDLNEMDGSFGGRKLFVGENSGPKLIENTLQYSLEHNHDDGDDDENLSGFENNDPKNDQEELVARRRAQMTAVEVKASQSETRLKGGKKRIQPILMQPTDASAPKRQKITNGDSNATDKSRKTPDTLENAMEVAAKAASGAEAVALPRTHGSKSQSLTPGNHPTEPSLQREQMQATSTQPNLQLLSSVQPSPQLPHSTDRIHSVELPIESRALVPATETHMTKYVADCTNSVKVPDGSSGGAVACAVLSISKGGQRLWKDQLPGSTCSAIAASKSWLFVGTSDGCVQIYGTSPTLGWESGIAYRSHPPFVLGRPVVSVHAHDVDNSTPKDHHTELVVLTSDGRFGVYAVEPSVRILYKGSIMPAMTHMLLAADMSADLYLPKLARIQLTQQNRLMLLLSLQSVTARPSATGDDSRSRGGSRDQHSVVGAGGSLQGFVYDLSSELWMRIADSRFVLSDFYNALPVASNRFVGAGSNKKSLSPPTSSLIANLSESVRMGASSSSLRRSRRGLAIVNGLHSQAATQPDGSTTYNDIASRSHCEDRMACALALESSDEFEYWFSMYIKTLAAAGDEPLLRLVVDMLIGKSPSCDRQQLTVTADSGAHTRATTTPATCSSWWLSGTPHIFNLDRIQLIKTVVIPEMSKNRSLQRYTNEVNIEVNML